MIVNLINNCYFAQMLGIDIMLCYRITLKIYKMKLDESISPCSSVLMTEEEQAQGIYVID